MDAAYKFEVTLEESARKRETQDKEKGGQHDCQVGSFKRPASPTKFKKSGRAKTETTQSDSARGSGWSSRSFQCFNCGASGHKSFDCRNEKKVCFGCGKEGHMQKFCRQGEQKGAEFKPGSVSQNNRPRFSPVEAPSPSMQTTAHNKGKTSVASGSQGQRLYMIREEDGPYASNG